MPAFENVLVVYMLLSKMKIILKSYLKASFLTRWLKLFITYLSCTMAIGNLSVLVNLIRL